MSILKTTKDFAILKSNTTFTGSFTTTTSISAWSPADVSPLLWLDASDTSTIVTGDGTNVDEIQDKSGNGYDFEDTNNSYRPSTGVDTINGNNVLTWVNDGMKRVTPNEPPVTIDTNFFMVLSDDSTDADYRIFQSETSHPMIEGGYNRNISLRTYYNDSNSNTATSSIKFDADTPTMIDISRDVATDTVYFNKNGGASTENESLAGIVALETVTGSATLLSYNFTGNRWVGKFCEFIIVNGTMTTDDKQKLQGYLAHKWGLQESLPLDHPYKDDDAAVLFGVPISFGDLRHKHDDNPSHTFVDTPPYLINIKGGDDDITSINISGNSLTSVDVSRFDNLTNLNVAYNLIPEIRMSQILVDLDSAGQLSGSLTATGNVSGGLGLTAEGTIANNNLIVKGWTITGLN